MARFEDLVTVGLIGIGILGGVFLHIRTRAAPIVVAVFLSTGIAAAVYRFLGGIEANLNVRGLQITGTMAALVGFAVILNRALVKQSGFLRITARSFVGEWDWDYPDEGWKGILTFKMEEERLTFTGRVEQLTGKVQRGQGKLLYLISNGTATIIDGRHLELECDTEDRLSGARYRWRTTEPLGVGFEFAGTFINVEKKLCTDDKSNAPYRWGLSLHKVLYLPSR